MGLARTNGVVLFFHQHPVQQDLLPVADLTSGQQKNLSQSGFLPSATQMAPNSVGPPFKKVCFNDIQWQTKFSVFNFFSFSVEDTRLRMCLSGIQGAHPPV